MDRAWVHRRLRAVLLVGTGGFAGAVFRPAVDLALPSSVLATLLTNVVGSFLLGLLVTDGRVGALLSRRLRLLAATGFLSSFTTYSTFAQQTLSLSPELALANVAASYGLGLVAVSLGVALARWSP
jgi:CrcB protein